MMAEKFAACNIWHNDLSGKIVADEHLAGCDRPARGLKGQNMAEVTLGRIPMDATAAEPKSPLAARPTEPALAKPVSAGASGVQAKGRVQPYADAAPSPRPATNGANAPVTIPTTALQDSAKPHIKPVEGGSEPDDPHIAGKPGTPLGDSARAIGRADAAYRELRDAQGELEDVRNADHTPSLEQRRRVDDCRLQYARALREGVSVCESALKRAQGADDAEIKELQIRLAIVREEMDVNVGNPVTPLTAYGRAEVASRAESDAWSEMNTAREAAKAEIEQGALHHVGTLSRLLKDMVASREEHLVKAKAACDAWREAVEEAKRDAAKRLPPDKLDSDPYVKQCMDGLEDAKLYMNGLSNDYLKRGDFYRDRVNTLLEKATRDGVNVIRDPDHR